MGEGAEYAVRTQAFAKRQEGRGWRGGGGVFENGLGRRGYIAFWNIVLWRIRFCFLTRKLQSDNKEWRRVVWGEGGGCGR